MIKMSKNIKEKCSSDVSLIAARDPSGPFKIMDLWQCVKTPGRSRGLLRKLKLRDIHLSVCLWFISVP